MVGAVVGLVTFAQIIGWLFKRFHNLTIALLTGLMVGSLRKLWPWKIDLAFVPDSHGGQLPVFQKNVLPDLLVNGTLNTEVILAVVFALIGLGCVLALNWQARRLKTTAPE
jgi:putative membrane protein